MRFFSKCKTLFLISIFHLYLLSKISLFDIYSETLTESDRSLESLSKLPQNRIYQEKRRDEDNEAEISEYLTLAQLGNILRELAVKGKIVTRQYNDIL